MDLLTFPMLMRETNDRDAVRAQLVKVASMLEQQGAPPHTKDTWGAVLAAWDAGDAETAADRAVVAVRLVAVFQAARNFTRRQRR